MTRIERLAVVVFWMLALSASADAVFGAWTLKPGWQGALSATIDVGFICWLTWMVCHMRVDR